MDINYIFRSYDIRGIYGKDLTGDVAEKIGLAIAGYLKSDIAIARDMRDSSNTLMERVIAGITKGGRNVCSLGLLPFGPGMFYAWKRGLSFVHITASHLPAEWGGIKIFHRSGTSLIDKEIIKLRDMVLGGIKGSGNGTIQNIDSKEILNEYLNYLVSKLKPAKKMRVVIDCGNGMAGLIARELFQKAGFEVSMLFEELDGSFPNRSSEPTDESLAVLKKGVNGSIGIAYDGDADRAVFVDGRGRALKAEHLAAVMLMDLSQYAKGPVVANVECTRMIEDIAEKYSLDLQRIRVGHPYLVSESKRLNAILGVEDSGHFILPFLLPFGDAMAVSLYAACVLSKLNKSLADIIDSLPQYSSAKLKFACSDRNKFTAVENMKATLTKQYKNLTTIDGVRVDMPSGWMLVRASNTEPIIRMTVEAVGEKEMLAMKEKFAAMLEENIKNLDKRT